MTNLASTVLSLACNHLGIIKEMLYILIVISHDGVFQQ